MDAILICHNIYLDVKNRDIKKHKYGVVMFQNIYFDFMGIIIKVGKRH